MKPSEKLHEYAAVCEQAARAGGEALLEWRGRFQVTEKGPRDLVTEADMASQNVVRSILLEAFSDHEFLGEEDELASSGPAGAAQDPTLANGFRWLVDPLDGTTNYIHQLHSYSVSVALEHAGDLLVGCIFDPSLGQCFTAAAGLGAFLNGVPLQVSGCTTLDSALVAASFSAHVARGSPEVTRFVEMLYRARAVRRLGSAALNFSYMAAGRLDGYWATSVKTWDVAAGVLILREAGGIVTDIDGTEFNLTRPTFVAAATPALHREMLEVLSGAV